MSDNQNNIQLPEHGKLTIPMTNDYLFRALLQQNNKVLTGLIASLLHLSPSEISSVEITNPIILGESINDKTFFLDIRVDLNQNTLINLEMQVINEHNWPERSLSYLCREFDQLSAGQSYESVKPAIQIGLLNFTLFPDHPEFYATYKLLNVKNHTIYSDKLQLSVLDLTQIHLATDEDKACHIDFWASLFKARTWEELHMLSQNNEYLKEASETVYHLTQEEKVRLQCQAREDYYRRMKGIQEKFEQLKQYKAEIKQYEAQKVQYEAQKAQYEAQKVQYEAEKKQFEAQKAQFAAEKIQSDAEIAELKQQIAALKKELEAKSRE